MTITKGFLHDGPGSLYQEFLSAEIPIRIPPKITTGWVGGTMLHLKGRLISIMVLYCVALHLCWGVILFVDVDAAGATPVSALYKFIGLGNSNVLVATLFAASMLAMASLLPCRSRWIVLLLMPQQLLLAVSAEGAVNAVMLSQFADGVIRSRAFIAADQLHVVLAAIGHAMAMLAHAKAKR